jgi:hypothetical protein
VRGHVLKGRFLEGDRGENVEADKSCERQADDDGDEIDSGAAEAVVLEGSGHDDSFVWVCIGGLGKRKTHVSRFALIRGS